jgi:homoserine dehydrogenase
MRIQFVGFGNVGQSLIDLVQEKSRLLKSLNVEIVVVSVSDSHGTAVDEKGLSPVEVLKYKKLGWKGFKKYVVGYSALDAIRDVESDVVVEMTPSTMDGEPGLSNVNAALSSKKHVVTSNKGPLVVAYRDLMRTAEQNNVKLLYEATVAAQVPVFCLVKSCFAADELQNLKGILNATTNFIIGEMEKGKDFREALTEAMNAGWAETNYSDDIDGIDSARKLVILANALLNADVSLEDVKVEGIRHVETMVKEAQDANKKVKLVCEISRGEGKVDMTVSPRQVSLDDSLSTVNHGGMGIKFVFQTSKEVFVSAQYLGPKQTAYAVLNDIINTKSEYRF